MSHFDGYFLKVNLEFESRQKLGNNVDCFLRYIFFKFLNVPHFEDYSKNIIKKFFSNSQESDNQGRVMLKKVTQVVKPNIVTNQNSSPAPRPGGGVNIQQFAQNVQIANTSSSIDLTDEEPNQSLNPPALVSIPASQAQQLNKRVTPVTYIVKPGGTADGLQKTILQGTPQQLAAAQVNRMNQMRKISEFESR
jgi:hypothetical protein